MMFHPGVLALLLSSFLITLMLCYSAWEGLRIVRNWSLHSGSEMQLALERKTYLVSTLMTYGMGFQVLSFFLFVYTADTLSHLFVGAMCAAGSLKVNAFGYPTLILKSINCLLAGVWLIVNSTDNKAYDYPLIRSKYWFLIFIAPLLILEMVLQGAYLWQLEPNIITSCCSVIFNADAEGTMGSLAGLEPAVAMVIFFTSTAITIGLGLWVYYRCKGAMVFSFVVLLHCLVSIVALISFISVYVYELPTHRCPFCLLHQEYGYIGYFFYASLLLGTISGLGAGVLAFFREKQSLQKMIPVQQKKLVVISLAATGIFAGIACWSIYFSNFTQS